jgi:uncharacterized protein involved in high-affinity Fe2+ transport
MTITSRKSALYPLEIDEIIMGAVHYAPCNYTPRGLNLHSSRMSARFSIWKQWKKKRKNGTWVHFIHEYWVPWYCIAISLLNSKDEAADKVR